MNIAIIVIIKNRLTYASAFQFNNLKLMDAVLNNAGSMDLEIKDGRIYVGGVESVDAELIGYAMLDFAENTQGDNFNIELKGGDVFEIGCARCK